ncbi:hypothetical protein [Flavobacterium flavigenum]|uniref:hypothetical protein n=1 Tax=Flavobacterium flavigenum TaxID=3003258 RepID=UPI0022AC5A06|nr:hypothetical protein [Flavobacterium flavigenum]
MNPIFTVSNTNNINGYWYDEFTSQFEKICEEHIDTDRAKKFAFIVYDFHSETHQILQDIGAFVELDRLSGKNITIFYLDGQRNKEVNTQNKLYENMNEIFLSLTDQNIQRIPFIVFFDFIDGDIENFVCYSVRDNDKFILNDLVKAISAELSTINNKSEEKTSVFGSLIKETPKILYTEFIKLIVKGIIEINK